MLRDPTKEETFLWGRFWRSDSSEEGGSSPWSSSHPSSRQIRRLGLHGFGRQVELERVQFEYQPLPVVARDVVEHVPLRLEFVHGRALLAHPAAPGRSPAPSATALYAWSPSGLPSVCP